MRISDEEQDAIRTVLRLGARFGYGNLMAHLATRWAETLMTDYGMDEASARAASLHPGYPFEMQEDLLLRGEWDETGKRYTPSAG